MKFIRNLSIKNKIIAVVLFTTFLTLFLVIGFISILEISTFKKEMVGETVLNARLMGKNCLTPLLFNDEKSVTDKLYLLQSIPSVLVGQVYKKDGKLFGSYNKSNEVFTYSGIKKATFTEFRDEYLVVSEPILQNNEFYGTVVIKASLEILYARINKYLQNVGIFTLFLLILAFVLAMYFQKLIAKPILELAKITEDISQRADYSVRVEKQNEDEIGILYDGFNNMLDQIQYREEQTNKALSDLKDSQKRFRKMSESAFDAIIVLSSNGEIIFWNTAAEKMFYYPVKEILDTKFSKLVDKSSFTEEDKYLNFEDIREGKLILVAREMIGVRKDLTTFPIEVSIVPVLMLGKWNALVTIRDIAQRKQGELELIKSKEKAEQSDKLKSAFLANMSHEIRTPMNSIIGFAELLADGKVSPDKQLKYYNFILSSGKSLLNLINDIIDISKIEAGQLKIMKLPCNFTNVLSELYASYNETMDKNSKYSFELRLITDAQDKNLIILTDPLRFKQIFINLIGNAFKFTEHGFIEFGYKKHNNTDIIFYVQDTGIGIPNEKQDLVFERFGQVDETLNKNMGGTGLGLTISKKLVELLGGKMWLESLPNQGSTFYFSLPIVKPLVVPNVITPAPKKKTLDNLSNKTILIAEDEETNYMFLEEVLSITNVTIIWAKNGKEAVDICRNNDKINLILMDVKMPILDGYKASLMIKEFNPDVTIIAQTAYAMVGEKEKSVQAKCNDYITKPISPQKLLDIVHKYLVE